MNRYPKTEKYETKWIEENWMGPNPLQLLEELWYPWAYWAKENLKEFIDVEFLDADTENQLTFFAMTAVKK